MLARGIAFGVFGQRLLRQIRLVPQREKKQRVIDEFDVGAELTGRIIHKDDLLKLLNKFCQHREISKLAARHGIDQRLLLKAHSSFRNFCLEAPVLPADLHVALSDILQGADSVDSIFPFFLQHTKRTYPHLDCLEDLKKISDLRDPAYWYPEARALSRKIIFHSGPTNSGKTHHALQRFLSAKTGVYCGPLKLLAVEVFNKSNAKGTPCDLVTGEERRYGKRDGTPANHVACTVEMTSLDNHYEVAVIDEIQMLKDEERGWAWTRALLGLQADEIHLCGEAGTADVLQRMLGTTDEKLEIRNYERLTKLEVENSALGKLENVLPGDCIVCFSKKDIFDVSRQMEALGHEVAVIYGSLPPNTKLAQAAKFNNPINPCKILVATDAIGMGLNLSIRRIIFYSLTKLVTNEKGNKQKSLISVSTALQIAGRAGRFGTKYEDGRVTTFREEDLPILQNLMSQKPIPISRAGLHLPEQIDAFAYHLPNSTLSNLMESFQMVSTLDESLYFLCNNDNFKHLADLIQHVSLSLRDRYHFCCSPLDKDTPYVSNMFLKFVRKYSKNEAITYDWLTRTIRWPLPLPRSTGDLTHLEAVFDVLDLYLWLSLRFENYFPDVFKVQRLQAELDKIIQKSVSEQTRLKNLEDFEADRQCVDHQDDLPKADCLSDQLMAQGRLTPKIIQDLNNEWNWVQRQRNNHKSLLRDGDGLDSHTESS